MFLIGGRTLLKRTYTGLFMALAFAGSTFGHMPAQAQDASLDDSSFDASAVIDAIDRTTLDEALSLLDATATAIDEEKRTFRIVFSAGERAVLRITACKKGPCRGLQMLSFFKAPEGTTAAQSSEIARKFSANYNPASVIISDRGEHVLKTYMIFDGGVTKENLFLRLAIFEASVKRYNETLYGEGS